MSNFDGVAERQSILDKLIAGGVPAYRSLADDEELPVDWTGAPVAYAVVKFGRPIPTARDRGMGVGERAQPHIMPISIACYGANADAAEDLASSVMNLLLGWQPTVDNSTELKAAGGYSFTVLDAMNKPSRYEEILMFTTVINMQAVDA